MGSAVSGRLIPLAARKRLPALAAEVIRTMIRSASASSTPLILPSSRWTRSPARTCPNASGSVQPIRARPSGGTVAGLQSRVRTKVSSRCSVRKLPHGGHSADEGCSLAGGL